MIKRFLASLMALFVFTALLPGTMVVAEDTPDAAEQTIDLSGEWHFKYYRKYSNMFQYFAYNLVRVTSEDPDAALLPDRDTWSGWEVVTMPYENLEEDAGGLLPVEMFPNWSEAWVVKEFEVGENFTQDETVTLLMGIIDDMDIIYINGTIVAGSGFVDGNGTPSLKVPDTGGFLYSLPSGDALEQGTPVQPGAETDVSNAAAEQESYEDEKNEIEDTDLFSEGLEATQEQPATGGEEAVTEGDEPAEEETAVEEEVFELEMTGEADFSVQTEEMPEQLPLGDIAAGEDQALPETFGTQSVMMADDADTNAQLFKFERSYWEDQREYTIPASVLNIGGTNTIAIRVYNNNGNGGFYSEWPYALCGSEKAVRLAKGLPTDEANAADQAMMQSVLDEQAAALADGSLDAYAATIWEDYNNDGQVKQQLVDEVAALLDEYSAILLTDENQAFYALADGGYYYEALRTMEATPKSGGDNVHLLEAEPVSQYFVKLGEDKDVYMLERGSRSHCYTVEYESGLFPLDVSKPEAGGQTLKYGIYLPPSYYDEPEREYPVVYLLHGINSSHSSFINVDGIEQKMNEWIAAGDIIEMIVVMPDSGKNSSYRDSAYNPSSHDSTGPWRTHITDEIRGEVESNYRTMNDAKYRGLTGISMGGGGAWSIGLERRDLYSSIASHMGALGSAVSNLRAVDNDVLYTYDFYLDCGYQDIMVSWRDTQNAHEYLESLGIDHGYDLRDGGHNSAFYMVGMPYSMQMHSNNFARNMAGYEKQAVSDPDSGLRLRGDVEAGAALTVAPLTTDSAAYTRLRAAKPADTVLAETWEISLSGGFSGKLQLTFTGLEEYEDVDVVMVHGLSNGTTELLPASVEDGELVIEVTSLSPFGLAVPGYDPVDPVDPGTSDTSDGNTGSGTGSTGSETGGAGSGTGGSGSGTGSTGSSSSGGVSGTSSSGEGGAGGTGGTASSGGGTGGSGSSVNTGDISLVPYLAAAGLAILFMFGLVGFLHLRRRKKQDTE